MFVLGIVLERCELAGPERVHVVNPFFERKERLGTQAVHANPRVRIGMRGYYLHQPASPEHAQMTAHRWTARLAFASEIAR